MYPQIQNIIDSFFEKCKPLTDEFSIAPIRYAKSVFKNNAGVYFYIKTRTGKHNWGVTKNILNKLEQKNWFLVLLSAKGLPSYLIKPSDVNGFIKSGEWKFNRDGDYKTRSYIPERMILTQKVIENIFKPNDY